MRIRNATIRDLADIRRLPVKLGRPDTAELSGRRLKEMLEDPNIQLPVYEANRKVKAFMAISFIPRPGIPENYAVISYFAVERFTTSLNVEAEMEAHAEETARKSLSGRLLVSAAQKTTEARRFFPRRHYTEIPGYYLKTFY
jgi:hypothetical protein